MVAAVGCAAVIAASRAIEENKKKIKKIKESDSLSNQDLKFLQSHIDYLDENWIMKVWDLSSNNEKIIIVDNFHNELKKTTKLFNNKTIKLSFSYHLYDVLSFIQMLAFMMSFVNLLICVVISGFLLFDNSYNWDYYNETGRIMLFVLLFFLYPIIEIFFSKKIFNFIDNKRINSIKIS